MNLSVSKEVTPPPVPSPLPLPSVSPPAQPALPCPADSEAGAGDQTLGGQGHPPLLAAPEL